MSAESFAASIPALFDNFVLALERAGEEQGLPPEISRVLVRQSFIGAAALLEQTGEEPAELRKQVTSPNGTTEAALKILMGRKGLLYVILGGGWRASVKIYFINVRKYFRGRR